MRGQLKISSSLDHDGDGVVRYRIDARSPDFRAAAWAWGNEADAEKLADLLKGFPAASNSIVDFAFGSPGTGTADLRFGLVNPRGHCMVAVTVSSEYAVGAASAQQSATVHVEFLPAALDVFCQQLGRFKPRRPNEAELNGSAA